MNPNNSISHFKSRKISPNQWANYFAFMSILILIMIVLMFLPIYLYIDQKKVSYLFLLIFSILAIFVIKYLYAILKKRILLNNQFNTYTLYQDKIQFEQSDIDTEFQTNVFDIELDQIKFCVLSTYYNKSLGLVTDIFKKEAESIGYPCPILIVFSKKNDGQLVKKVHFYEDDTINLWLGKLKSENIQMYFIPFIKNTIKTEDLFFYFENKTELLPFTFEESWFMQEDELILEYDELQAQLIDSAVKVGLEDIDDWENSEEPVYNEKSKAALESVGPAHSDLVDYLDDSEDNQLKKKQVLKIDFYNCLAILVLITIFEIMDMLDLYLVENPFTGFSLLFALSFFYYKALKNQLKWAHLLRFPIVSGISSFVLTIIFMMFDDNLGEAASNFAAGSIFIIAVTWIPFLIFKVLNTRRKTAKL